MKKKKTIIAIITLLLVVTVGATFAYYTSSASFTNIFNTGTYRVVTTETFESPSNWAPGQEIPKTITSTNEGTVPAAVRVSYVEKWEDLQGNDITSQITTNPAIINLDHTSYWIQEGNYYYYKYILEPEQTTKSFIKSVTLNPNLNSVECTASQDGLTQDCSATSKVTGAKYILTITKETVQADKYQELWNTQQSITKFIPAYLTNSGRTKDTLQVGDEICVEGETNECFNFIRYDGDNVVMLSKWNLKVGNIYDAGANKIREYTSTDDGYGLQSSEAKAWITGQTRYGTAPFSTRYYWDGGTSLDSKYGSEWNKNNVYDTDYTDASGDNYSIAYYVENYKNILESYDLPVQEARLLTYDEATTNVGCSGRSCPTGFIINTSFWLGSAGNHDTIWIVHYENYFYASYYSDLAGYGVRPVIVISKSEIR